jgi:hypothetical protein
MELHKNASSAPTTHRRSLRDGIMATAADLPFLASSKTRGYHIGTCAFCGVQDAKAQPSKPT